MDTFWRWISLITLCVASSACAMEGVDADGRAVRLPDAKKISVVIYSNEHLQHETRRVAQLLDPFHGRAGFRQIILVDLRNSWGRIFKDMALERMREDLDLEAKRVRPFYKKNANTGDPREDLVVIPDFDGEWCKHLGWKVPLKSVEVVVINKEGKTFRWNTKKDASELVQSMKSTLP